MRSWMFIAALLPLSGLAAPTNTVPAAGTTNAASRLAPPATPIQKAAPAGFTAWLGAGVEQFKWKEVSDGRTFVEEEGPLFSLGGGLRTPLSGGWAFAFQGRIYGGAVDYDGGLQNIFGGYTPYSSKTTYVGVQLDATVGYTVKGRALNWQPFGGLGVNAWQRRLDTDGDFEVGQYGYIEDWTILYALLGTGLRSGSWYGHLALHLPILNDEKVDLSESDGPSGIDLEPGRSLGYEGEVGYEWTSWRLGLGYTYDDFKKSDLDSSGSFLQPASERGVISLQLSRRL